MRWEVGWDAGSYSPHHYLYLMFLILYAYAYPLCSSFPLPLSIAFLLHIESLINHVFLSCSGICMFYPLCSCLFLKRKRFVLFCGVEVVWVWAKP